MNAPSDHDINAADSDDTKQKAGQSLSKAPQGGMQQQALTPLQMEERRLIHRQQSVRAHADAFRELRTRLITLGGELGQVGSNFVTLVAPVRHGCGGSFVARNLAAAFAFDDTKQALLIDCDTTHPAQSEALQVEADQGGLIDYLENESVALSDVVYSTGVPRLQLIPCGRIRETPGESFSSFRMRSMIDSLRAHHGNRHLILDCSPALGSPDARILSELADLIVVVVGYGQVGTEDINKAVASFPPEKFAGVVFNQRP